jgi:hypothetical protein
MDKVKVNILLDREIREKCREYGINISAFTEIKLREYISIIDGDSKSNKCQPNTQADTFRARGLVGYDVALTWRRSPVQIWPGPFFKFIKIKKNLCKLGFYKNIFHKI